MLNAFRDICDPCSHAHTLQHSPLPGDLTWFDVLICCYMTSLLKQGRSFKANVFCLVPTLNLVKPQLFADTKSLAGHLSLLCLYPKPSSEEVLWSEMRSLEGKKLILACLSRFILLHPFHLNHLKVSMKWLSSTLWKPRPIAHPSNRHLPSVLQELSQSRGSWSWKHCTPAAGAISTITMQLSLARAIRSESTRVFEIHCFGC